MNKQRQWLFEAPFTLQDIYPRKLSETQGNYSNREYERVWLFETLSSSLEADFMSARPKKKSSGSKSPPPASSGSSSSTPAGQNSSAPPASSGSSSSPPASQNSSHSAANANRLKQDLAKQEIAAAKRKGSAHKKDLHHMVPDNPSALIAAGNEGKVFSIPDRDNPGKTMTLTQVVYTFRRKKGIAEWLVNSKGQLVHKLWIPNGGVITGEPNKRLGKLKNEGRDSAPLP